MPASLITQHKRTKIVCTIGPASSSSDILRDMIKAGMNVARFNFSHGTHDSNRALLQKVRRASRQASLPVALLLDLQGPKIRIGELPAAGLELREGSIVTLVAGATTSPSGTIPVPYRELKSAVEINDLILLDDGTKELQVIRRRGSHIQARVLLGGTLLSHKGINIPHLSLVEKPLTTKDEADLRFGLQQGIDFVALSFVRSANDVIKLKQKIKRYLPAYMPPPQVIVKIEKPEALEHFDAILAEADAVMIARGDLGLETPIAQVPLHQKGIIHKCLNAGKPVITATEMLGTMQFNPRPTRAEVSDVANAVFDHTDAVMLSGETAMGKFPVRAVRMMNDIIISTEASALLTQPLPAKLPSTSPLAIAENVVALARMLNAKAIIVSTQSGYFARAFSRLRPHLPILALAASTATYQQLLLSWGITPVLSRHSTINLTASTKQLLLRQYHLYQGDPIMIVASQIKPNKPDEYSIHLTTL